MRKYLQIFIISWNEMLIYKNSVFLDAAVSIVRLLLAYILWKAIFSVESVVEGFTFNMMMTYYVMTTFMSKMDKSEEIAYKMSEEIREGKFTKYIVKPIHTLYYFMMNALAKSTHIIVINGVTLLIWMIILKNYIVFNTNLDIVVMAIIVFMLGLFFLILFHYFLAILTFWFSDISALFLFKNNIVEFLMGTIIPISLLPNTIISFLELLPFYYVLYYPISLYLNNATVKFEKAIVILIIWIILFGVFDLIIYRIARKYYDGVDV